MNEVVLKLLSRLVKHETRQIGYYGDKKSVMVGDLPEVFERPEHVRVLIDAGLYHPGNYGHER